MADGSFKRPDEIEYESINQDPYNPVEQEDEPLDNKYKEEEIAESTAAIVVDEYTRTIEFMKFLEGILRDTSKVEVEFEPEDDPEVWMAMNRIFSNPSPKMNQESYFQVVDQLEVIERIEQVEDSPRSESENIPDNREVEEGEIDDSDFQVSAIDEIKQKSRVTRSSAFKEPPPPSKPPKPPKEKSWLRRWRKQYNQVDVLNKPYKVQWLSGRWWRARSK